MKKLQTNFTTKEQSKRLLELGVPADSADCCVENTWDGLMIYVFRGCETYSTIDEDEHPNIQYLCWSVGRLIEIYEECVGLYYEHSRDDGYNDNLAESIIYKLENAIDSGNNFPNLYPIVNFSKLND